MRRTSKAERVQAQRAPGPQNAAAAGAPTLDAWLPPPTAPGAASTRAAPPDGPGPSSGPRPPTRRPPPATLPAVGPRPCRVEPNLDVGILERLGHDLVGVCGKHAGERLERRTPHTHAGVRCRLDQRTQDLPSRKEARELTERR